jgi:hypothetical protein
MNNQKEKEIFKHFKMITDSGELKWSLMGKQKKDSQSFEATYNEYKILCSIEEKKNYYWIFILLKNGDEQNSCGSYTNDSDEANDLVESILKATGFDFSNEEEEELFDDFMRKTGVAERRDKSINELLLDTQLNQKEEEKKDKKGFFDFFKKSLF